MTDDAELTKQLKNIKKTLMAGNEFAAAKAKLLHLKKSNSGHEKLTQQLALCTYKDNETAPAVRYAEALKILESIGLGKGRGEYKEYYETLRLGGAIYKRKWKLNGHLESLHQAYILYRDAADNDPNDDGYGAVNAAFILDLLSARARVRAKKTGTSLEESEVLMRQAIDLRQQTLDKMLQSLKQEPELGNTTWFPPTLAEVYFGLGKVDKQNYLSAKKYLEMAVENGIDEWEMKTTFTQLVAVAKEQHIPLPEKNVSESEWDPAWQALIPYQKENTRQALECYRGRVGLALSGGGFRASFYHIGVLARLAEMDVLRSVEVLSTVSGGSIVGAQYYLEVQNLLLKKVDGDIDREDYIKIVKRLQAQFFTGVSKNLRMRTFINLFSNIAMIFKEDFSRSHRIGSLYERDLYSNIGNDKPNLNCDRVARTMADLIIKPKISENNWDESFNPNKQNWNRNARAPALLLNTTSLNSGHNWRFTARWMGEPPGSLDEKVDKNSRYQWMYYCDDKNKKCHHISLGNAVAASACVPGLFEPLKIDGIYPGHDVKLVDGGVHDNQGVAGLLDESCTLILCSDASGQMASEAKPGSGTLGVPLRSNDILMDRVRESQYQNLESRVESKSIEGLFFTHLKDGLEVDLIKPGQSKLGVDEQFKTGYGIHPHIQKAIAAIRTDLDCFTEVEANALMLSGYKMTQWHFKNLQEEHEASGEPGTWGDYDIDAESGKSWTFLDEKFVTLAAGNPDQKASPSFELNRQLKIGASLFFKVFKLVPALNFLRYLVLAILIVASGLWLFQNRTDPAFSFTVGQIFLIVFFAVIAFVLPAIKWLDPKAVLKEKLRDILIGIIGSVVSIIQVYLLDPVFLRAGKLKKLFDCQ